MSKEEKESENLLNLFDSALSGDGVDEAPLFTSLLSINERYTDHSFLAAGGMKSISKVFDTTSERYVALAKLHENSPKNHFDSFIREARLTAKLEHPNIMTVHDIGVTKDNEPYFTMELKNGGSLEDILTKRKENNSLYIDKYSRLELLDVFLKVCDAIAFAHSKGVIHLDLKPANIQIGDFGEVLVCDWGIGKVLDSSEDEVNLSLFNSDMLNDMTLSGHIKGTPGYMAPEQISTNEEKNKQTDIYSLGCILYSILTDEIPVSGSTEEKLQKTKNGEIPPANARFPSKNIPTALSAVAHKAMAVNTSERYSTVNELSSEVQKHLMGYATEAEDAGTIKQIGLFWQRNKAICTIALASLCLVFILSLYFVSKLKASRDLALASQEKAEKALELYKTEKKNLEATIQKWSVDVEASTGALRYQLFFNDPKRYFKETITGLKKAIKLNPENKLAHGLIGHQYFMTQKFNKANEAFAQEDYDQEDLYPISQAFSKLKKSDDELLSIENLNLLIQRVTAEDRRKYLSERILEWDQQHRRRATDYSTVTKSLLYGLNNNEDFSFTFNSQEKSLKLEGKGLKTLQLPQRFSSAKCLLRFIPLKELTLINTKCKSIADLDGLHYLTSLDIHQNKMLSLNGLHKLTSLKKLILNKKDYNSKELKKISDKIEVINLD